MAACGGIEESQGKGKALGVKFAQFEGFFVIIRKIFLAND
jgi:hypothetical protein